MGRFYVISDFTHNNDVRQCIVSKMLTLGFYQILSVVCDNHDPAIGFESRLNLDQVKKNNIKCYK